MARAPPPDLTIQTHEFLRAPGEVSLHCLVLRDAGDGRTMIRTTSAYRSVEARDAMLHAGMEGGVREGFERLDELVVRLRGA